jgi:hypothetical protein
MGRIEGYSPAKGVLTMPDICERKHQGNAASIDAYTVSVNHHESDRERIYRFIARNIEGVTSKEIGRHFDKPLNTFSGRLTELVRDGLIRETDMRRNGARVMVAVNRQGRLL